MVLVKAGDVGATATELPGEVNANRELSAVLEKIRGVGFTVCFLPVNYKMNIIFA